MSGESAPAPQDKTQMYVLALVAAVALAALYKTSQPAAAPAPVVIQPAPAVAPVPAPAPVSPCGPNRCPYRALPFPATCPYCRNRIVAFPPAEAGQVGTLAPPAPAVGARK